MEIVAILKSIGYIVDMRKKQPYRIIVCVDDEFKSNLIRLQTAHHTSNNSDTIRRVVLLAAKEAAKEADKKGGKNEK